MQTVETNNSNRNTLNNNSSQSSVVEIQPSLHDSTCNNKVLLIIRLIFFLILSARFYLQVEENKTFLDIFLFLTNVGFTFTIMFFCLSLTDYLLNEMFQPKVSPR